MLPSFNVQNTNRKKFLYAGILILLIIIAGIILANNSKTANQKDSRIKLKPPKDVSQLNKEFSFPIKDSKGKELTRMKMYLDRAELGN